MSKNLAYPAQSPHLKLKTSFDYMTVVAGMPAKLFNDLSDSLAENSATEGIYAAFRKWVISRADAAKLLPLKDSKMASDNGEIWLRAHFGIKWSEVMKYTEWDKLMAGQKLMAFCERHKDKLVFTVEHERFG